MTSINKLVSSVTYPGYDLSIDIPKADKDIQS